MLRNLLVITWSQCWTITGNMKRHETVIRVWANNRLKWVKGSFVDLKRVHPFWKLWRTNQTKSYISFHSEFTLSIIKEHYLFFHKSRQGPQLVGPVHVWKCLVWKHIEWAVTWPELRRQQYQPWITWRHTNMCPWKDLRNSSRQIKLRHLVSFLFVYMSSFSTLTNWMTDSPTHILTLLSGCNIINSIQFNWTILKAVWILLLDSWRGKHNNSCRNSD